MYLSKTLLHTLNQDSISRPVLESTRENTAEGNA